MSVSTSNLVTLAGQPYRAEHTWNYKRSATLVPVTCITNGILHAKPRKCLCE